MTPYHPLTSTGAPPEDAAMIWPWPHNWASPVSRRCEWSTVVLPTATGDEQRQARREYPREQVTYDHLLEGSNAALALTLLRSWKGRPWLVPDWTEADTITAPAGAVLSLSRGSLTAGLALLGTEVVTLLDRNGTLDVAPSGSWPAGTAVVPLRLSSLDDDQTVSQVTGEVSRVSPTFLFEDVRPVDETTLTRIAQPASVTTSGAFTRVAGAFGGGVRSSGLTLARSGIAAGSNVGTLEFWINVDAPVTEQTAVVSFSDNAYAVLHLGLTLDFIGIFANKYLVLPSAGTWHHCAISCDGATTRVFLNGVHVGVPSAADQFPVTAVAMNAFGYLTNHAALSGALDDCRYTRACRYTTNFTPAPCLIGEADPFWADTAFVLTGESSRWGSDPSGAPASDPRSHMLPMAHNWADSADVTVSREVDVLDPGEGLRHTRPTRDASTSSWSYSTLLEGEDDIAAFRALLQQHRGSAISFYASPPGAEITVTGIGGGVAIGPHFRFWPEDYRPFPLLAVLTDSGWSYFPVDRVRYAGANLVLQLSGMPSVPAGAIQTARGVHRARILGDVVEIRYLTPGVAEVSLPLVSVAQ